MYIVYSLYCVVDHLNFPLIFYPSDYRTYYSVYSLEILNSISIYILDTSCFMHAIWQTSGVVRSTYTAHIAASHSPASLDRQMQGISTSA